ncbi:MAG: Ig-like domain repeat protein, partial [Actinomycetota bacterium]|nr:Ig-like domain repeat protein [Actinomycetota bacterium]
VQLAPPSIVANGTSTTTATATVTDVLGPLSGETVVFTDPSGNSVQGVDQGNGTYTATLTSSTTAGIVTITATDTTAGSFGASGSAPLTQTPGPAANVTVGLAPTSIPADGSSATTATATVTDVNGNRVPGDTVVFLTSFGGQGSPQPAHDNGDGTYTATITSSTTPGPVQVVAVDQTTGVHGQATLLQTGGSSNTALSVVPAQPVTNQTVTMIATVTASPGAPAGTVAFQAGGTPIPGCANVSVTPAAGPTAVCQTSFAAANSPVSLTAVFTPSGAGNPGSTSTPDLLSVGEDSTSIDLTPSSTNPTAGNTVTYLAAVVPKHAGPIQPSGFIQFSDGNRQLDACASQPLLHGNSPSGAAAAVCRVSFGAVGPRVITAHYLGDASFTGSDSPSLQTVVGKRPPPQRLLAVLQWSFVFHPTYTTVPLLQGNGVPAGATVQIKCRGHGCPYAKRVIAVSNAKSCKTTTTRRCTKLSSARVGLAAAFLHHHLRPGTQLTVEILRPGWIAKYFRFTIRAGHAPRQLLSCLAPGGIRPGAGC